MLQSVHHPPGLCGNRHAYPVVARSSAFLGTNDVKLARRRFLHLAAGAAALPIVSRIARAQAYPTRPVRVLVGFGAGGSADFIARLMGQWLPERLGQPFVIE